jgi:hypothetical protein
MGAASAGSVSKNRALKEGKRYDWGAERPGVIEKRVQIRMQQIDAEMVKIREEGEKKIARRLAAKQNEKLKLVDQQALVEAHRKKLQARRSAFRSVGTHVVVPTGTYTDAEMEEVKARNPGISDLVARAILDEMARQAGSSVPSEAGAPSASEASLDVKDRDGRKEATSVQAPADQTASERAAKPAEQKAFVVEKPKPAPVHIAASVTISSPTVGDDDVRSQGPDWSGFDPEAWVEGQDYPEERYREVTDRDGYRILVARTDEEDLSEVEPSPEVRALWAQSRELSKEQDELMSRHGQLRMTWPQSALDRMKALSDQQIAIDIQMEKLLEG